MVKTWSSFFSVPDGTMFFKFCGNYDYNLFSLKVKQNPNFFGIPDEQAWSKLWNLIWLTLCPKTEFPVQNKAW